VLQDVVPNVDLSNEGHPFGTVRSLSFGVEPWLGGDGVQVKAVRVSFAGDLGWEMHCAMEDLPKAYDFLMAAGEKHGLENVGYACIGPARIERKFLHWGPIWRNGVDVTPEVGPTELGFPIKKDNFQGKDAIMAARKAGIQKRLVSIVAQDPEVRLSGMEQLYRNGAPAGHVPTASFSPSLERAVGIGWAHRFDGEPATWSWITDESAQYTCVGPDGVHKKVTVLRDAAFDPQGLRAKADRES